MSGSPDLLSNPTVADWLGTMPQVTPQQQGVIKAATVQEPNPDQAAKDVDLARQTGLPYEAVKPDSKNIELQLQRQRNAQLLKESPELAAWVGTYPGADELAHDDMHVLHNVIGLTKKIFADPVTEGLKGFREGFGEQPLTTTETYKAQGYRATEGQDYRKVQDEVDLFNPTPTADPVDLFNRIFSGVLKGGSRAAGVITSNLTGGAVSPEKAERELGGLVEWGMMRGDINLQHTPEYVKEISDAIKQGLPYLEDGKVPPPGLNKVFDDMHKDRAKADAKAVQEAEREVDKSATLERSRDAVDALLSGPMEGRSFQISADAVRELYGDTPPEVGDGILGDVENIGEQLRSVPSGHDIEIPASVWFTKVEKEVRDALRDDLRVRKDGITLNEAKEMDEHEAATKEAEEGGAAAEYNISWNEEHGRFEAKTKEGNVIGSLDDAFPPDQQAFTPYVEVAEPWRRQGVATALYKAFAERHGGDIRPAGNTSPEAWELWLKNYPEKVVQYVKEEAGKIADDIRSGNFPPEYAENATNGFDHPEVKNMVKDAISADLEGREFSPKIQREPPPPIDSMEDVARKEARIEPEPVWLRMEVQQQQSKGLFENAKTIGMDQARFDKYMKLIKRRNTEREARELAKAKVLEDRKTAPEYKAAKAEITEKVRDDVANRPDILADEVLRKGVFGEGRTKLDEALLTDEQKAALPKEYYGKGGIDPSSISALFGYDTGEALIRGISELNKIRDEQGLTPQEYKNTLVRNEVERQLGARFGDRDKASLEMAREVVRSGTDMEIMHEEMLARAQQAGIDTGPLTKEAILFAVKEGFAKLPRKLAADLMNFVRESYKAGLALESALMKGDFAAAFKAKQAQYMANLRMKEAQKLAKEIKKTETFLKQYSKSDVPSTAREYIDQIQGIMSQLGESVRRSTENLAASLDKESLEDFITRKIDPNGQDKRFSLEVVPDFLFDPNFKTALKDMTVEQYRAVDAGLKALAKNGKDEKLVYSGKQEADLAAKKAEMREQLATFREVAQKVVQRKPGAIKAVRSFLAQNMKMEVVFHYLSDLDPSGVFNQWITRDLMTAQSKKAALEVEYSKKVAAVKYKGGKLNEIIENPYLIHQATRNPLILTREGFLALLSNVGNFGKNSNFEKFHMGYDVDPAKLWDWLKKTATKEDWEFVSERGKLWNELADKVDEINEREGGAPIDRLPLTPFNTGNKEVGRNGVLDGWYHPLIYDRTQVLDSKLLKTLPEFSSYQTAATPRKFEKARTGFKGALSTDLSAFIPRMEQVIHDIAFREAARNAGKILFDTQIQRDLVKHAPFGMEMVENEIKDYMHVVATGRPPHTGHEVIERASNFLAKNAVAVYVGFGIGTVLKHTPTAWVLSMRQVGSANFLREVANMGRDPEGRGMSNRAWAMKNIPELQDRHRFWMDNFGGSHDFAIGDKNWGDIFRYWGSYAVAMGDLASAIPTGLAAYRKAVTRMTQEGKPFDHDAAANEAGQAIRLAHSATGVASKAMIMHNVNPLFTPLMGFFNGVFNRSLLMAWKAADAFSKGVEGVTEGNRKETENVADILQKGLKATPSLTADVVTNFMMVALIEELVSPQISDDNESLGMRALKGGVHAAGAQLPIVRDAIDFMFYNQKASVGMLGNILQSGPQVAKDVWDVAVKGKAKGGQLIRHAIDLAGFAKGVGPDQVGKAAQFIYNVETGKEQPYRGVFGMDFSKPETIIPGITGNNPSTWYYGIRHGTAKQPKRR
jgi:hypothetical protein